jgi:hypothetical protein
MQPLNIWCEMRDDFGIVYRCEANGDGSAPTFRRNTPDTFIR